MTSEGVDKRARTIQEIIATEKSYVGKLNALIEVYIEPLRTSQVISEAEIQGIFSNWQIIQRLNQTLLTDLEQCALAGADRYGALFYEFSPYFRMYSSYLNNYETALEIRAELTLRNSNFVKFIEQAAQDARCNGLTIADLLIEPVQRIPRYKMLLEQLLKHTDDDHPDYESIRAALERVSSAATHNNEQIRRREMREQILQIMSQFDAASRLNLLDTPSRTFIKEAIMQKLCRRGPKDFKFWLFSDKMLYGEPTTGGKYGLNREIDLRQCRVGPVENVQNTDKAFQIESPSKSFIVWARHPQEKTEWIAAITAAMQNLRDQYLQETGKIAPIWTPDNAVSACETCHTKFTVMFRRHHCRNCGNIVCSNCSSNKWLILHIDPSRPVRVCDSCFRALQHEPSDTSSTESGTSPLASIPAYSRTPSAPVLVGPGAFSPSKPAPRSKPKGPTRNGEGPPGNEAPQFDADAQTHRLPPPPPPPQLQVSMSSPPGAGSPHSSLARKSPPQPPPKPISFNMESVSHASLKRGEPQPAAAVKLPFPGGPVKLTATASVTSPSSPASKPAPAAGFRPPPPPKRPPTSDSEPNSPTAASPTRQGSTRAISIERPASAAPTKPPPPVPQAAPARAALAPPKPARPTSAGARMSGRVGSLVVYSYEELKTLDITQLPPSLDPTQRELLLSDAEFESVFGCTKAEFAQLPKWKATKKKREVGLF